MSSAVTWLIDASNGEDVKDNNEEDEELEDERNAEEEDAADGVRKDESLVQQVEAGRTSPPFAFL
jgi:hypothetical protein